MDLEVIGRHALLFDDDALAGFVNSREALVDWNSLSIDRYDVRHLLSSPPPPRNRSRLHRRSPSPNSHGDSLESDIDRERYLDLPSPSDEEQDLKNAAVEEDAGGYHTVAFSYGAATESFDQKDFDAESSYRPPFSVPEHLLQNLPPTEKVHQIIARTATFVNKHGGQSEIVLRVKQGDNPTFGFLLPDHNLHPYFRFLVDHQELLKSDINGKSVEEGNTVDGSLNQMGGGGCALSLLGSVYGSGEDEEGTTEDDLALRKNEFEEAADTTVSRVSEQNNSSSNAAGKDEGLSKPPSCSLKERAHIITRNRSIRTVKPATTIGSKKDGESMGSLSLTVEKLQPSLSTSLSKIEPPVLEPSSDMKRVVDKIVEFILRNGREFEAVLVEQDTKYGRFPFLLPSNQYHGYYLKALQKAQENKLAGKNFNSEKHDSMGDTLEKKSGNKESDSVSLSSDIPHESDRKEKFKMVIGKSKKDEKDPPSKVSQPQFGVCVDAASAAAILQAARKGLRNPNIEILLKARNSIGQGPSTEGGDTNQKPDRDEDPSVSVPEGKGIAKTQAVTVPSEADSSDSNLTQETKIKAERLKRAKMFAAMIKSGAAPVKSEPMRGPSIEPSESGLSASDFHVAHLVGRERESSPVVMEGDTCDTIEKAETKRSADELSERRSRRSYRSRSKRGEEEEGEGEGEGEDGKEHSDHKHSRKKRRSHRSSRYSRDRHSKHRHKRDGSSDDEQSRSRHKRRRHSSSDDEQRRSRHKRRHDNSSDDDQKRSRRKHRHDSSSEDELRRRLRHDSSDEHGRHKHHKHNGFSDDEQMHSRYIFRNDSSDDEHRHYHHGRNKHGISSDDDNPRQAKSEKKHRKTSHSEREADLEEGEIITKSDQSKVSEGGDGGSREPSVDLSKSSSRRSASADVSDDLRAKIRAILMATL